MTEGEIRMTRGAVARAATHGTSSVGVGRWRGARFGARGRPSPHPSPGVPGEGESGRKSGSGDFLEELGDAVDAFVDLFHARGEGEADVGFEAAVVAGDYGDVVLFEEGGGEGDGVGDGDAVG